MNTAQTHLLNGFQPLTPSKPKQIRHCTANFNKLLDLIVRLRHRIGSLEVLFWHSVLRIALKAEPHFVRFL
jgi:hypothetical protein